ncbi:putative siderophore transport system ATP-binding protein YusV [Corynebacterium kalinowskii]|uniref:Siderophore transport system ATP-binding protein YusV n=1 Tax=Corynebacterium kalinowskii TaxID=2675216 RepID=A0A6B8VRY0_9CORY|nr:ABC transporter ATP-binding protein [Corynebacterium kalinowskii]QGU01516.1 putative siderophore transport system ATP-binding protein YusV [Corynebacterium kalinowskii]
MELVAQDIVAGYASGPDIVRGVSLSAQPGTVTTLLGPNGCGKSTFLKTLSRVLSPRSGSVQVGSSELHALAPREAAKLVGMLAQQPIAPPGITVSELVERGRHPHRGLFGGLSTADKHAIEEALDVTGVTSLGSTYVADLSGGQRQRVWFAMVLAQDTPVILLDEPTTYLDPAHAIAVLSLAREQARAGKTVIMVLHDLMLAGAYSDRLVLMKDGALVSSGTPAEVLTSKNLAAVYGLEAEIWEDPSSDSPVIVPRGVC